MSIEKLKEDQQKASASLAYMKDKMFPVKQLRSQQAQINRLQKQLTKAIHD